jgi:tetratricopeptide (TPR) repeat protein
MSETPKILVGASIPRSGHHFLQNLLTKYFGSQMHYCEFYSPKDCCKQVPCTRRGDFSVIYQKSHDRDMEVPKDLAAATYVLQYRHPVPEALSDRELDVQDGLGRVSLDYRLSRHHYAQWLAAKAVYYRRYHDKWLAERVPNGIYLDYQSLSADPVGAVERIVSAATGSADRARITAVIEAEKGVRVSAKNAGSFKPRVIEDSPHFDADLLGAFEDYVLRRAPLFGYERMLKGSYQGHMLHGLILAIDEAEPLPAGQTDRLQAAVALAGEHPELMIRLAQRALKAGDMAGALKGLRRVAETAPSCTTLWRPLFAAYRQAKETPPAELFGGDALLSMVGRPEQLTDAGKALLDGGRVVNAIAALTLAVGFAPKNVRAHHLLAVALLRMNQAQQALPHAEMAASLGAADAANAKLLASVQRRLANRKVA